MAELLAPPLLAGSLYGARIWQAWLALRRGALVILERNIGSIIMSPVCPSVCLFGGGRWRVRPGAGPGRAADVYFAPRRARARNNNIISANIVAVLLGRGGSWRRRHAPHEQPLEPLVTWRRPADR